MMDAEIRARDAAQLLEHPLFVEAMAALRTETTSAWVGTKVDQAADRERLWTMIKMQDRLEAYFRAIVEEGRFAASKVARQPLP